MRLVFSEMHVAGRGLAVVDKGSTWGPDSDIFTQNYMITKKLTFDILFKSTRKIFPNYVLGKKTVSDI